MAADLDLCFTTGTEAIQAFKAKKLSPVELMNAVINRCEEVNPKLNAITYRFFERARTKAKEAEQRYLKSPGDVLPRRSTCSYQGLHPVKDEITTFGSKIFEHNRPDYTAATVQQLLDAGAIMHIRSTTPEFAYSGNTHSPL